MMIRRHCVASGQLWLWRSSRTIFNVGDVLVLIIDCAGTGSDALVRYMRAPCGGGHPDRWNRSGVRLAHVSEFRQWINGNTLGRLELLEDA